MIYPKLLENLIDYFKKFPGVGEKSAERLALALINFNENEINDFSTKMVAAKKVLHPCPICGNLTDQDECNICSNKARNHNLICVVEDYKNVFIFEKIGNYNGIYHVLNGLISPIDGINPDDINLQSLVKKCKNTNENMELILALKPSIEGETTSQYIKKIINNDKITITRLSYGIPVGAEIDYLDALTLERAFDDRKNI